MMKITIEQEGAEPLVAENVITYALCGLKAEQVGTKEDGTPVMAEVPFDRGFLPSHPQAPHLPDRRIQIEMIGALAKIAEKVRSFMPAKQRPTIALPNGPLPPLKIKK